jgi:hypothetical protein
VPDRDAVVPDEALVDGDHVSREVALHAQGLGDKLPGDRKSVVYLVEM